MKYLILICCIVGILQAVCVAEDNPATVGGKPKLPARSKVRDKPKPPQPAGAVSQEFGASLLMGFIAKGKNPKYHVDWRIGLEVWEDSKLTPDLERWDLHCNCPIEYVKSTETDCKLERMIIFHLPGSRGDSIKTYEYSSGDGMLQILDADWKRGILDFSIIHSHDVKMNVYISMAYFNEIIIHLITFKAISIMRVPNESLEEKIITVEYKIPEYTYMSHIQIEIPGMKPENQKTYDNFVKSLSEHDQSVFEKESKDGILPNFNPRHGLYIPGLNYDLTFQKMKAISEKDIKDWTREERENFIIVIKPVVREAFEKSLSQSLLSKDGKEKLRNYISSNMEREIRENTK